MFFWRSESCSGESLLWDLPMVWEKEEDLVAVVTGSGVYFTDSEDSRRWM